MTQIINWKIELSGTYFQEAMQKIEEMECMNEEKFSRHGD